MSLPNSSNPPMVQKQGTSVYTVMLLLSFAAIVTGTVLLYMELNKYGQAPWWVIK